MLYSCLYKQIKYLNRTINLTMTTKIKEEKDGVNNLCKFDYDYVIFLDC